MSDFRDQFEDALKSLPEKKLSWWADRRVRKMLKQRSKELQSGYSWGFYFQKLVAVPVALVLLVVSVGSFGFYSPSVVQGDFLYPVKT